MRHPPVTSSATGEALPTLRRAARHYLRSNRKGPEDNLNSFPCPLLLQVRGRPSACLLVAHLYRPPPGGGPPTWQVGACAGQSSPRAAAAALPSDREYIENRPNELASILGTVPEHLSLEKKPLPGRVFIPRCAQNLKKCILRQNGPCSVIARAGINNRKISPPHQT